MSAAVIEGLRKSRFGRLSYNRSFSPADLKFDSEQSWDETLGSLQSLSLSDAKAQEQHEKEFKECGSDTTEEVEKDLELRVGIKESDTIVKVKMAVTDEIEREKFTEHERKWLEYMYEFDRAIHNAIESKLFEVERRWFEHQRKFQPKSPEQSSSFCLTLSATEDSVDAAKETEEQLEYPEYHGEEEADRESVQREDEFVPQSPSYALERRLEYENSESESPPESIPEISLEGTSEEMKSNEASDHAQMVLTESKDEKSRTPVAPVVEIVSHGKEEHRRDGGELPFITPSPFPEQPKTTVGVSDHKAPPSKGPKDSAAELKHDLSQNRPQQLPRRISVEIPPEAAPDRWRTYLKLQKKLEAAQLMTKSVSENPTTKRFAFDLKKFINSTINTLYAADMYTGVQVLNQKFKMITDLLRGKPVQFNRRLMAPVKTTATRDYCLLLTAKCIVNQAENNVGDHPDSVFPLCTLSLILWKDFENFGDLLVSLLFDRCPWLVPYMKLSDKVEWEGQQLTQFMKEQSGLVKFYASLMVAPQPPAVWGGSRSAARDSPLGVGVAWQLLADTANLKPTPVASALVLTEIISVCDPHLRKAYGRQYSKLLRCFFDELLPALNKVSGSKVRGTYNRLKSLLEETLKTSKFP